MKSWVVIGAGIAVSGALVAVVLYDRAGRMDSPPDLREPRRIAAGKLVYDAHCASCHGRNLEGQPDWMSRLPNGRFPAPPHDDSGHTWHHSNEVLFALTKHGMKPPYAPEGYSSDMPAFAGILSDDDIWNVLAFIQSRWSDRVRTRHDQLTQKK
jgi:S-disulfanyl-L-cysteine oxidoreductase SoxD